MTWRSMTVAVLAACLAGLAYCPAARTSPRRRHLARRRPARPFSTFPSMPPAGCRRPWSCRASRWCTRGSSCRWDREGKLVGEGSVDKQIEQVLNNLDAVLGVSGSGLGKLVRLNVYAITPQTVDRVREQLSKRLDAAVRPVMTAVLTPLPHRQALVAVDAIAVSTEKSQTVALKRCEAVAGTRTAPTPRCCHRAGWRICPACRKKAMWQCQRSRSPCPPCGEPSDNEDPPAQVVQLKVFLRPASSASEVARRLKEFFPVK